MTNVQPLLSGIHEREHTIIGRNKIVFVRACQDGPPRTAYSGVNYHKMNGTSRKIRVGLGERQCAIKNVKRLHRMADIHNLGLGGDAENCPFYRAHKMIVQSEVGRECNDRTLRQVSLLNDGVWTDSKVMVW